MGAVDEDLKLILVLLERLPLHLLGDIVHDTTDAQSPQFWRYSVYIAFRD